VTKHLTCDINRRMYMSEGPCQRCPESRAAQPGANPTPTTRAPARCCRPPRAGLLHLLAPGVSLPQAGRTPQTPGPRRRCEGLLHGQALARLGRQTPGLCCLDRLDLERDCQSCGSGHASPRGRTWLGGRRTGPGPCVWNINLIGCCRRNWPEPMSCWCRTRSVQQLVGAAIMPPAARRF